MDSLLEFPPKKVVQSSTEAGLTAVFEMGTGEPDPYDRPKPYCNYLHLLGFRFSFWALLERKADFFSDINIDTILYYGCAVQVEWLFIAYIKANSIISIIA